MLISCFPINLFILLKIILKPVWLSAASRWNNFYHFLSWENSGTNWTSWTDLYGNGRRERKKEKGRTEREIATRNWFQNCNFSGRKCPAKENFGKLLENFWKSSKFLSLLKRIVKTPPTLMMGMKSIFWMSKIFQRLPPKIFKFKAWTNLNPVGNPIHEQWTWRSSGLDIFR